MSNPNSKQDLARIDQIIANIHAMLERPGLQPLTSENMRVRANTRHDMATAIKLTGGKVRQEYR